MHAVSSPTTAALAAVPLLDALLPTAEAAVLAGVKPATVRQWDKRGHLVPAARDERGWPLYLGRDVLRVEARTRPAARRQPIPFQHNSADPVAA